jgi:16S rRNA (guanine527-N7)-methyltransferase
MPAPLKQPKDGWPLARTAKALGVPVPEPAVAALATWLDLLTTWNARVDLTAARSADELVDLMLADALVLSRRIPAHARVVDVGTGAGAPGLALAILRTDLDVTLVEPLAKRGAFLRTVLGTLALTPRVALDGRRGDAVASSQPNAWDVALARATLAPAPWLELAARLVKPGGSAWVFLAREPNPETAAFSALDDVSYVWPLTKAERRLVRYELKGAHPSG